MMPHLARLLSLVLCVSLAPSSFSNPDVSFLPAPGEEVTLSFSEIQSFRQKKDTTARGYIEVIPPKGQCVTVTTSEARRDQRICKRESVAFYDYDVDWRGELRWRAKQGPLDTGRHYIWKTPLRTTRFARFTDTLEDAHQEIVIACRDEKTPEFGRRVRAILMDGTEWVVGLPATDTPAPKPEAIALPPSLTASPSSAAAKSEHEPPKGEHESAKESPKGERESESKNADSKSPAGTKQKPADDHPWEISGQFGFQVGGNAFIGNESNPAGNRGECRYSYFEKSVNGPAFECHFVGDFRWVFLPLTCLSPPYTVPGK